jgi:riboflavin kinase/FMN adenylyltransferase
MAVGFFDGVHLGHQQVLRQAISCAGEHGGEAWVLTFDTHPAKILRPNDAPPLLTSLPHKLRLLTALAPDGCVVVQFTQELAGLSPSDFIGSLCNSAPTLKKILVGANWKFGKDRAGTAELLQSLAVERGVTVEIVDPVLWDSGPVSSTRIRRSVAEGRMDDAAAMLGRRFSILGTVVEGRQIGRRLGFPTANLDPHNEVRPPEGVYAVRALLADETRDGVLSIGKRETFTGESDATVCIELHLPGLDASLYGTEIEVMFVEKLRDQQRFTNSDALQAQIAKDISDAIGLLAG